ncbi:hypothetical protein GCM10010297_21920 [Streptomyces malachitofuscus]|nr:hypothetical protein GCM10010297_21920 [Streptomyces malachitofuscus]
MVRPALRARDQLAVHPEVSGLGSVRADGRHVVHGQAENLALVPGVEQGAEDCRKLVGEPGRPGWEGAGGTLSMRPLGTARTAQWKAAFLAGTASEVPGPAAGHGITPFPEPS